MDMDVVAAASAMMSIARTADTSTRGHKRGLAMSEPSSPRSPSPKRTRQDAALQDQAELMRQAALHISTLEQKNAKLLDEVQKLQLAQPPTVLRVANVAVARQLRETVEALQTEKGQLQAGLEKLRTEHTSLVSTYSLSRTANASLLAECVRLRGEKDASVSEIAELRSENKTLTARVENAVLAANNARLQANLAKERRQNRKWGDEEVMALINGVRAVYRPTQCAMDWTAVLEQSPILQRSGRFPFDLKDKWRNLERTGVIPTPMPKSKQRR